MARPAAAGGAAPDPGRGDRRRQLAGAVLSVLATQGARGLTHRAVDDAAGLPRGSINYYVSTRAQLLELALDALFQHDLAAVPSLDGVRELTRAQLAHVLAALVLAFTAQQEARELQLARFELLLEGQRRPEFADRLSAQRGAFVRLAGSGLGATGCATPGAHAEILVSLVDGLIVRQLLYGGGLTAAELESALAAHLTGC